MLNHHHQQMGLFQDHDQDHQMSTQMGFFSFPPNNNLTLLPPLASSSSSSPSSSCSQSLKTLLLPSTTTTSSKNQEHQELVISSDLGRPHLLSLQRSSAHPWTLWEGAVNHHEWLSNNNNNNVKRSSSQHVDHEHQLIGVSTMKMKKMKAIRRKVREPRFCFKTMSDVDVLDDGYKWRKYGQKVVKNTQHPRSYYRCTQDNCRVKKRVERLAEDPRMVITTYEGRHAHSPSLDLEHQHSPSHLSNFFW